MIQLCLFDFVNPLVETGVGFAIIKIELDKKSNSTNHRKIGDQQMSKQKLSSSLKNFQIQKSNNTNPEKKLDEDFLELKPEEMEAIVGGNYYQPGTGWTKCYLK
ncbi:MAG: hypothetical protein QNJ74_22385 [Trichodesmium sp. MO_231.B1]|nr:hypothetical protein [Trichodesmium sp. MO_231.B1]